jgi:uncharacterized protein (TIGR03067 family)
MQKQVRWSIAACLAVVVASAALAVRAADDDPASGDLRKLQGKWVPVRGEKGGRPMPEEALKIARIVIRGDTMEVYLNEKKDHEGKLKLDSSTDPKQFDLIRELNGRETVTPGIYVVERDTFKICADDRGEERPKEFKTEGNPGFSLMVLKRK